ncbi:MAG: hypothetical protein PHP45_04540 [Elusimicrobiales bacterium]|nr:hypothetical protein [Elusimicrobiales bacterium]
MTTSFDVFFKDLVSKVGVSHERDLAEGELRGIISAINEYFYTTHNDIGTTRTLDEEFAYFSEFHKFWEKYHEKILNPEIGEEKCSQLANILNDINIATSGKAFNELYDTFELQPEEICKIRYFAANQDFRGSRDFEVLFQKYSDDPTVFDKEKIRSAPEDFLKSIGITSLSQNDKRVKFATTAARMLIEKGIEPFKIFNFFEKDLLRVREFLTSNRGSGFGNKKTDMFIRDMVVLGIWQDPANFDKIDVASDINTIKVALRTGILRTKIPLVSSFLDIFCYQYGLIDRTNALAWRKVWEKWQQKHPATCIASPALIDYFVYRVIGKDFCKESLCIFKCESEEHTFVWHSSRNKTCQICRNKKAELIKKVLPCTHDNGDVVIKKSKFVSGSDALLPKITQCPFVSICNPQSHFFSALNPPKSISILGQTGWESARTLKDFGGGGLMS